MELLAIMYHYVFASGAENPFGKMHYMPLASFKNQVDHVLNAYEPVGVTDIASFLSGKPWAKERPPVVFTFDDGLRCHYENVFPFFKEKGIPGQFFIITSTVVENAIPFVHKSHLLGNHLGDRGLRDRFLEVYQKDWGPVDLEKAAPMEKAVKTYRWDPPEIKQFKYFINFGLSDSVREKTMNELFRQCFGDGETLRKQFFMTKEDIVAMAGSGMEIGGHSHLHKPLSGLPVQERQADVNRCLSSLQEILGKRVRTFSYPYGKRETFDEVVIELLRTAGLTCAFSTIVGKNPPGTDCFMIRRLDPKDVNA